MKNIKLPGIYSLLLLLLAAVNIQAQDFSKVDSTVKSYSSSFSDVDKLAAQINRDFKREDEKARAIFTWIATNIRYDNSPAALGRKPIKYSYKTEAERRAKIAAIENDLALQTLRTRKGVCHGYAMLYMVVAKKTGLESEVVRGAAKALPSDIGKLPTNSNHAWNSVKVNGVWRLIDVTWGAGGITNSSKTFNFRFDDNFFFTDPDTFFLNHFPDDKKWLLTSKSATEFASLPLYYDLNYELQSPAAGIIKATGSKNISFRVKGLKAGDNVAYQFTSGTYSNKVTPKIINGVGEFSVLMPNSAKGNLTIFVNGKSVGAYKVN